MADEREKGNEEEAKARKMVEEELPLDSETKLRMSSSGHSAVTNRPPPEVRKAIRDQARALQAAKAKNKEETQSNGQSQGDGPTSQT